MIDDFAKGLLASQKGMVGGSRACVELHENPLSKNDSPLTNDCVRYTNFLYTLRFQPSTAKSLKDYPFLLKSDLLKAGRIRVRSYTGLWSLAKQVLEVKWILNNCEISQKEFIAARANSWTDIPIRMKIVEYTEKVMKKIPNCPDYYPVLKEYNRAIAEVRRWQDCPIKKGRMTEKEMFKEI